MESISKNWNPDLNYWDVNPIMKTFKIFRELYNSDKSKKKSTSSKMMWAIAMYVDPHEDNAWRNVNPLDKAKLISEEYLEDPKFDFTAKDIAELVEAYEELCLTPAERQLTRLYRKMAEREKFISATGFTLDYYDNGRTVKGTADQLDRMLTNTPKIYQQLEAIKDTLAEENLKTRLRGGEAESATDEGLL